MASGCSCSHSWGAFCKIIHFSCILKKMAWKETPIFTSIIYISQIFLYLSPTPVESSKCAGNSFFNPLISWVVTGTIKISNPPPWPTSRTWHRAIWQIPVSCVLRALGVLYWAPSLVLGTDMMSYPFPLLYLRGGCISLFYLSWKLEIQGIRSWPWIFVDFEDKVEEDTGKHPNPHTYAFLYFLLSLLFSLLHRLLLVLALTIFSPHFFSTNPFAV